MGFQETRVDLSNFCTLPGTLYLMHSFLSCRLVRAFQRAEERKRSPTVPATFFSHWASGVNDSGRSPSPSPRLGDSSEGQEQRLEGGLEQVRGISDGDGKPKSGVSKQGGVELLVVQPKEGVI